MRVLLLLFMHGRRFGCRYTTACKYAMRVQNGRDAVGRTFFSRRKRERSRATEAGRTRGDVPPRRGHPFSSGGRDRRRGHVGRVHLTTGGLAVPEPAARGPHSYRPTRGPRRPGPKTSTAPRRLKNSPNATENAPTCHRSAGPASFPTSRSDFINSPASLPPLPSPPEEATATGTIPPLSGLWGRLRAREKAREAVRGDPSSPPVREAPIRPADRPSAKVYPSDSAPLTPA
jgi:hypothetical protein